MSATGRSDVRHPDDFYSTPAWCTRAIWKEVGHYGQGAIIEPSCGDGAIVKQLLASDVDRDRIVPIELDSGRAWLCSHSTGCDVLRLDFLEYAKLAAGKVEVDLVIGNPPFSLAQEFIEAAIGLAKPSAAKGAIDAPTYPMWRDELDGQVLAGGSQP